MNSQLNYANRLSAPSNARMMISLHESMLAETGANSIGFDRRLSIAKINFIGFHLGNFGKDYISSNDCFLRVEYISIVISEHNLFRTKNFVSEHLLKCLYVN